MNDGTPEASTSFIVTVCNNHNALVEALKLANNCLKEVAGDAYQYTSVKADIEQLLNQIQNESKCTFIQ